MARKIPFTPAALDAFCVGKIEDPQTPGLALVVLASGKKTWRYRRRVAGTSTIATLRFGLYPAHTIAVAREWAQELNAKVELGIDPRAEKREVDARAAMTVRKAHGFYMEAVRAGRASRARRPNKPRTIRDKQEIFDRDIATALGNRIIYEVEEADLIRLVEAKAKTAKVRANRLAAELKVFFSWAASLRGLEVGLKADPSRRLGDLKFPETPRSRKLELQELEWFLAALVDEERDVRRGMLLWLLTAARLSEVVCARSDEVVDGIWTIPAGRTKNSCAHRIALGPWGRHLMHNEGAWVFPAQKADGPRRSGWYKARDRVKARMEVLAGRPIERFTPHDFRRTVRSNTKRLKLDYETAEAMLNHVKKGLERTYDRYDLDDEMRAWFGQWEDEVIALARRAGVAERLEVPTAVAGGDGCSPKGAGLQPRFDVRKPETWAPPMLAVTTAKLVFGGEALGPAASEAIDLSPR